MNWLIFLGFWMQQSKANMVKMFYFLAPKTPLPSLFHLTESSSGEVLKSLSRFSISPIWSSSQSLKSLAKLRFQPPWPRLESHTSLTLAFLWPTKVNNGGKVWESASLPHHLSVQNKTLFPFPTLKSMLSQHQSASFIISFHSPTP